jgi:hypothetical protein
MKADSRLGKDAVVPLSDEECRDLVTRYEWRSTDFAAHRGVPRHAYVVRGRTMASGDFDRLTAAIRTRGVRSVFQGNVYKYLDIADYYYWHMGMVINRRETASGRGECAN